MVDFVWPKTGNYFYRGPNVVTKVDTIFCTEKNVAISYVNKPSKTIKSNRFPTFLFWSTFFVSKLKCGEFVLVNFFMSTISTVKSGEYFVSTFKSGEFYHSLLILFTSLYILFSLIYMQLQMIGLSVIYENLTLIYDLRNTQMHAF